MSVQPGCVVCLGFFDGVHRGHAALLHTVRQIADQKGLLVCAHTFSNAPAPKAFLLTTLSERVALLRQAGADTVVVSPFDDQMRHMSGQEFFDRVIMEKLHAVHIVCGEDHRFGYRGACGVAELRAMCRARGVGLTVVPPVTLPDGRRVSSSAIRQAIADGDIPLAEEMLGRRLQA